MDNGSQLICAIERHAEQRPRDLAICIDGNETSWSGFAARVDEIASFLLLEGVQPGARVVLLGEPSLDYFSAMFATGKVGGIVAPVSLMLTPDTISVLLEDADPAIILVDAGSRQMFVEGGEELAPFEDRLRVLEQIGSVEKSETFPSLDRQAAMSLIYSSGTTGVPKGIIHSFQARDLYGSVFSKEYGITAQSRTLLATAPYSNGTWMMVLPTVLSGGALIVETALKVFDVPSIVSKHQISHAFLVPTQLNALFTDCAEKWHPANEITIVSAGSFLPLATKQAILDTDKIRLFELFGNTEGAATILRPSQMAQATQSVGTPISSGVIAVIGDDDRPLGVGQIGEIVGGGPLASSGYYNRPEQNNNLFWHDAQGNKLVRTGDLGAIDEQGFLHLRGRKKDMIVSGGINVYPADIEEALRRHTDIADAAVVGVAHKKWGETPYAFVLPVEGRDVDTNALLSWINDRLNKFQRLSGLQVCSEFPRNALGKVMKAELLDKMAISGV